MVDHKGISETARTIILCIILLGITAYVIFSLKPSFDQILDFIPYVGMFLLGYAIKKTGNED